MEEAAARYRIFNPEDRTCPVCTGLNHIYGADLFHNEMKIPEAAGKGYYRRLVVKPSMKISICDMTFNKNMVMGGKQEKFLYNFAFCLGTGFLWNVEGDKREHEVDCGDSYVLKRDRESCIRSYHLPDRRILGFNVEVDAAIITNLLRHKGKEHDRTGLSYGGSVAYNGKISPAVKLILNEIMNCRYRDQIKRIYLEGKILELVAVYLDETVFGDEKPYSTVRLSAGDLEALHQARKILDENIASPPTIGKLAKLIYLNEYKLKTGFKTLFGTPVHAYVINKRLEAARFLLEEKKLRITEVALTVGYNDLSYFAEKFREKYGVRPSEYGSNL